MGTSLGLNTTVNNIQTNINSSLIQKANASAQANCTVNMGNITFGKIGGAGCTVEVTNLCSANATAAVDAVLDAVFKSFNELTTENKQAAATAFSNTAGINTTVNNIQNNFNVYVEQNCGATSDINLIINTQNISIGDCAPTTPVVLKFTNSGNAKANCIIGLVQKVIVSSANEIATKNTQSSAYGYFVMAILGLGGMFCFVVYIWIIKRVIAPTNEEKIRLALAQRAQLPWSFLWEMVMGRT